MNEIKDSLEFVDAVQMNKENPDTFEIPSTRDIEALKPGDFVKVCAEDERFWVIVNSIKGNDVIGTVNDVIGFFRIS